MKVNGKRLLSFQFGDDCWEVFHLIVPIYPAQNRPFPILRWFIQFMHTTTRACFISSNWRILPKLPFYHIPPSYSSVVIEDGSWFPVIHIPLRNEQEEPFNPETLSTNSRQLLYDQLILWRWVDGSVLLLAHHNRPIAIETKFYENPDLRSFQSN